MTHTEENSFRRPKNLFRDNNNKTLFPENLNLKFKKTGNTLTTPKIKYEIKKEQIENKLMKKSSSGDSSGYSSS
jgi:hypothetical protein